MARTEGQRATALCTSTHRRNATRLGCKPHRRTEIAYTTYHGAPAPVPLHAVAHVGQQPRVPLEVVHLRGNTTNAPVSCCCQSDNGGGSMWRGSLSATRRGAPAAGGAAHRAVRSAAASSPATRAAARAPFHPARLLHSSPATHRDDGRRLQRRPQAQPGWPLLFGRVCGGAGWVGGGMDDGRADR